MSVPQREAPIKQPVIYPDSDGQPIAENTRQFDWIVTLVVNLQAMFANNPDVFVAGDLFWYPVEGDNRTRLAPDALVARVLDRLAPGVPPVRAAERVPLFSVVEFTTRCGPVLTGFSSDASPEALFVRTLTPARAGARLALRVTLAGQRIASSVEALVAWSNPPRRGSPFQGPAGMGLRLERMDTALAAQFQRFVPRALGFSLALAARSSTF